MVFAIDDVDSEAPARVPMWAAALVLALAMVMLAIALAIVGGARPNAGVVARLPDGGTFFELSDPARSRGRTPAVVAVYADGDVVSIPPEDAAPTDRHFAVEAGTVDGRLTALHFAGRPVALASPSGNADAADGVAPRALFTLRLSVDDDGESLTARFATPCSVPVGVAGRGEDVRVFARGLAAPRALVYELGDADRPTPMAPGVHRLVARPPPGRAVAAWWVTGAGNGVEFLNETDDWSTLDLARAATLTVGLVDADDRVPGVVFDSVALAGDASASASGSFRVTVSDAPTPAGRPGTLGVGVTRAVDVASGARLKIAALSDVRAEARAPSASPPPGLVWVFAGWTREDWREASGASSDGRDCGAATFDGVVGVSDARVAAFWGLEAAPTPSWPLSGARPS